MQSELNPNTNTQEVISDSTKEASPVWLGIKLFFVDAGSSIIVGIALGIALVIVGAVSEKNILIYASILGLVISMYVSFLLYKRYSQQTTALIALMVTGLIFSAISSNSMNEYIQGTQQLLLTFATLVSYGIGWYIAKQTQLRIFVFGNKWVTAFMIVGILVSIFTLLEFVTPFIK